MREQRKIQSIAMTAAERDAFLAHEHTCRVATVDAGGAPHVAPLWFVWDGEAFWLNSIVRSQRWVNLARDGRISVVVDAGEDYAELRGVELSGTAVVVGEVPRTSAPDLVLNEIERRYGAKYRGGVFEADGRHAWLRITPDKIVSWDFRKRGIT